MVLKTSCVLFFNAIAVAVNVLIYTVIWCVFTDHTQMDHSLHTWEQTRGGAEVMQIGHGVQIHRSKQGQYESDKMEIVIPDESVEAAESYHEVAALMYYGQGYL